MPRRVPDRPIRINLQSPREVIKMEQDFQRSLREFNQTSLREFLNIRFREVFN
jgi:hypothetical protein